MAGRHRVAALVAIAALASTGSAVLAAPGGDPSTRRSRRSDRGWRRRGHHDPLPATDTTTTTTTTTLPATDTTTTTTLPATDSTPTTTTTTSTTTPAATTAAPAPKNITVHPEEIGDILATIRYMESRGQYLIPPNKGNASGAYQFIGSTWQNYGGYAHAYLAPPHIQDERAAKDVKLFLEQWDNDVSMIPVLWYYPNAAKNPALMDVVPVPSAGNTLTIREYQQRWLVTFSTISGEPVPQTVSPIQALQVLGLAPQPPQRDDGLPSIEFPVLGPVHLAVPDCETDESSDPAIRQSLADIEAAGLCSDTAPSIMFGVKLQPVRAATDGVVTAVDDEPGSGRPIAVTITDVGGRSYVHSGFNDDNPGTSDGNAPAHLRLSALAKVGTTVWAGQIIGFMGDTDPIPVSVRGDVPTDDSVYLDPDAVAPHIRLSIHELDGSPVDAFGPVVDALFRTGCQNGIGRWAGQPQSKTHDPVIIETTDNNDEVDSEWIITATGQVHASGWAAMVSPGPACGWVPTDHYGPGAAGSKEIPGHWWFGLDLPTDVWLQLALAGDDAIGNPLLLL